MLDLGDKFTLPGQYKRRSLREWWLKKPKELKIFTVTHVASAYTQYEELSCKIKE